MTPRLLLVLLLSLLAAGWTRDEGEQQSAPSRAERALARGPIITAPALGLWSHTFVRQRSGKIVAVGFSRTPPGVALVRYMPDGRLDRSFGRRVWPQLGAGSLGALAAVRQRDDRIVAVGCQPPDCWGSIVLARFHRDGDLDDAFGEGGLVRTEISDADLTPRTMALQRDGKIVVAGELQWVSSTGVIGGSFVARYQPDGRLDHGFGQNGIVSAGVDGVGAVLVQPNGRILVGGADLIVRLLPSGRIDTTFRVGGAVPGLSVSTLLLQRDGKIVAGGSGGDPRKPVLALARLTANGTLDRSFASRGRLLHRRRGDHWARVETLLPSSDDRIVAVGWATRGTSVLKRRYRFVFLLVTPSGRPDPRFADGGRRTVNSVAGQALAAFRVGPRRLVAVGPDTDLKPKKVVFSRVALPG